MTFNGKKAIYLQISDMICDQILTGIIGEEERVPSVRETAAQVEVNSNTVMRSYDWMQNQEIIYTKRGLGYFVMEGAKDVILKLRKSEFINESIPELVRSMKALGIDETELIALIKQEYEK